MKSLLLIVALATALTATAGDTAPSSAKGAPPAVRGQQHPIPQVPNPEWKISAKEYAELLEECGQTTNYGLATDEPPAEAQTRLASNTRHTGQDTQAAALTSR